MGVSYAMLEFIITHSLHSVLTLTGVALNVVLLVVFINHPEIRTPENLMLVNLCVSDLVYLISLFFTPSIEAFIFNKALCYFFTFCRSFAMAFSVSSVAALSIQRYLGLITFTNRLPENRKDYRHCLSILAGIWMLAAVLATIEVLLISFNFDVHNCVDYWLHGECGYRVFAYGVIPSSITAVFYIAASRRVSRSARELPTEECVISVAHCDRRRKSARILFALAVVFAVTYLPFSICVCFLEPEIVGIDETVASVIFFVSFFMCMLSPIFNPIAMIIANTQLRELYKKYCCCGLNRFQAP